LFWTAIRSFVANGASYVFQLAIRAFGLGFGRGCGSGSDTPEV
jgi:hypothetical protein